MAHFSGREDSYAAVSAQLALVAARSARATLQEQADRRQNALEGQNTGERYGLAGKEPAAIVLGLMAGVRFNADSDTPNSVDEKGNTLYYPDARPKVSRALAAWAAAGVRGAISLGNIIDRGNGMMRTRKAVAEMLSTFAEFKSHTWRWRLSHVHSENVFRSAVLHVPGEHDLAYASVEEVTDLMGFSTYTSSRQSPPGHAYHMVDTKVGWRLIFLHTLDVSVASPDLEKREEARAFLDKKRRQGGDATVSGGAVGRTQLTWLREQLASAGAAGDKAVVFSYAPLSESLARQGDASLVCWNCKEVMEVMFAFPGVVPLCLSGQQLLGGRACDDRHSRGLGRIQHVGLKAVLATPEGGDASVTLSLFKERVELQGAVSASIPCGLA